MEQPVRDKVYQLVNPHNQERVDKTMFAMAMHFLYKKKQAGAIELPNQVPEETLLSIDPEGFFKMKQRMMGIQPQIQRPQVP